MIDVYVYVRRLLVIRREGGRGTEISTLLGGQNLGDVEDIEYFKKKLYRSLNVHTLEWIR